MSTLPIDYTDFMKQLADAASAVIIPHFRTGHGVENKAQQGFDPVTIADRAGETAIRKLIKEHYPDHGILGEEHGSENLSAEYIWVLDPIDGTRAFISGLPTWGTLIGLLHNGIPVSGIMAQPYVGEYYGGDGKQAWYEGPLGKKALKTRPCTDIAEAVLFTTTPALFSKTERAVYDAIEADVRLPRYGTDCYGYCMVAAGYADLVIETGLQSYDIVALVPIIEGAGGCVTSWTGDSPANGGRIVASGDPVLHEEILARLSSVSD